MLIIQEKALATAILKSLQFLDKTAIVAGGAPRDWWFGKECKDLDIYIRNPYLKSAEERRLALTSLGYEVSEIVPGDKHYVSLAGLIAVYECVYEGKNLNFMFMEETARYPYVQDFSCSICEVFFDGGDIIPNQNFIYSTSTGKVLIHERYTQQDKHVKKMMEYFPQFKFFQYTPNKIEVSIDFSDEW